MKKLFFPTAVIAAAVAVLIALTLPARRIGLSAFDDRTVAGLLHVHTNRSDGQGSPDDVAAAAARAGLKFVLFTDHGDATRTPDPPQYRSGVLCMDGVEISTSGGHYIAIDMPASPYPLGGEARDVVEDVRRLGGFGIAAHPDSPKAQLAWIDWTAPIDGVELVNLDTSWRVIAAQSGFAARRRMLTALLDYPFRAPEVMAGLIQPPAILSQWSAVARQRRVVTIAGADAHARIPLQNREPDENGVALPIPGYEPSFRVMSVRVRPERPLANDAAADAALIARAIRNGHLYTAVDGLAGPPSFEFTATNDRGTVSGGDVLGVGGPVALRVRSNAPPGFTTVVREGIQPLSVVGGTQDLTVHGPATPGVFWAEIVSSIGTPPITWLRSNPVYVRGAAAAPGAAAPAPIATQPLFDGASVGGWRVEHDPNSVGAVEIAQNTTGMELRYRFGLAGGDAAGQFTALLYELPSGVGAHNRVAFSIRTERAMRVSLQVRDTTADRWQRSIYVDTAPQERTVRFDDLTPVAVTHVARPDPGAIRTLMFVIDTTNTKPGTSGRIWIRKVELQSLP